MPKPISTAIRIEWEVRIHQQRESGLSIAKWCSQNQLTPHTFYYWKSRLFPKSLTRSSFVELPATHGTGIRRDHMKVLYWDGDGFVIYYKRLEKGSFVTKKDGSSTMQRREFLMLLEGITPKRLQTRFTL